MSTQPEPATEAGRVVMAATGWTPGQRLFLRDQLAAIERQATAAARAEVARRVREAADAIDRFLKDKRETGIADHVALAAVADQLRALEDAAPRQPEPSTQLVRGHEYCRSCDRDLTLGTPHRADCRADLDYPAAPRQPELYASFGEMVRDLNAAAPDTTTGTTDDN